MRVEEMMGRREIGPYLRHLPTAGNVALWQADEETISRLNGFLALSIT
jgi:hypothetical protein